MRRDAIFYQIFKRFPSLLFILLDIPLEQVQGYRFESVEVKEPSFRIDGVFLPPETATTKTVFFVEVQFQKDQALYHRFFSELFLYLYRNQEQYQDWQGVLIFPSRGLEPDQATIHRALLGSDQVRCLYFDELDISGERSIERSLFRLMVAPQETLIEQAKTLITRARRGDGGNLSAAEIIDLVATIAVYKFVNLSRIEVEAMLGLTLEQTRVYQEAKEEGRQEGLQEGRQEGLQEGRLQAKLEMISMLLEIGLTVEQIADRLQLDVALIQHVANSPQQ